MGFMDSLTATTVKKSVAQSGKDKMTIIREKAIKGIEFQMFMVDCQIKGTHNPIATKMAYMDNPDGTRTKQEVSLKRTMRWFGQVGDQWVTTIKYGTSSLVNSKGLDTFVCGTSLEDLKTFYQNLISAVSAGHLDADLLKLSEARGLMRKGFKAGDAHTEHEVELEQEQQVDTVEEQPKKGRARK